MQINDQRQLTNNNRSLKNFQIYLSKDFFLSRNSQYSYIFRLLFISKFVHIRKCEKSIFKNRILIKIMQIFYKQRRNKTTFQNSKRFFLNSIFF